MSLSPHVACQIKKTVCRIKGRGPQGWVEVKLCMSIVAMDSSGRPQNLYYYGRNVLIGYYI